MGGDGKSEDKEKEGRNFSFSGPVHTQPKVKGVRGGGWEMILRGD